MKKANVCEAVLALAAPIAEANGCQIYDIEFKKEGSDYFLRLYIELADKDKTVSLDECEAVSRALSEVLDKEDPIEQAYMLEVSSPGIDRQLKKEEHFKRFIGEKVDIGLYKAINGAKVICGVLKGFDGGVIALQLNGSDFEIALKDTTYVKLSLDGLF